MTPKQKERERRLAQLEVNYDSVITESDVENWTNSFSRATKNFNIWIFSGNRHFCSIFSYYAYFLCISVFYNAINKI